LIKFIEKELFTMFCFRASDFRDFFEAFQVERSATMFHSWFFVKEFFMCFMGFTGKNEKSSRVAGGTRSESRIFVGILAVIERF
jgi:hypothetical protein